MKKCCIFSRVSSLRQSTQQQSLELKSEAYKNGYSDDEIVVIEWNESAIKLSESERLSIQRLYQVIESEPIECVICRELSRIARRPDVLYSVRDFLISHQVQLIITQPYMRLLDEKGKLSQTANIMFSLFSSIAESEMSIKIERFREGKLRKKSLGKWAGGFLPIGYCYDPDTHDILIDPVQRDVVLKIFDLYVNQELSTVKIARLMNQTGEMSTCKDGHSLETAISTIGSILKNPAYIGQHPIYRGKIVDNIYPPIISKEIFDKAGERLERHNSRKNANIKIVGKHIYFCSDILFDRFGNHLIGKSASNSYRYVRHDMDGTNYQITIPINLVDSVVWHYTRLYIKTVNPSSSNDVLKRMVEEKKVLEKVVNNNRKKVSEIDESIIRTNERIVIGKMSERTGDVIIERFENEKEILDTEFLNKMFEIKTLNDRIESLKSSRESGLDNLSDEEISELTHKYIDNVTVIPTSKWGEYELSILYKDMNSDYCTIKSMSKKCFNVLGNEIQFKYMERFIRNELNKNEKKKDE